MITAKEARSITEEAKRTGNFSELQELENTLEGFEPRIRRACENGVRSAGFFRLNSFHFLSDEQIKVFVTKYFSERGFTVDFSPRVSRSFSLKW